MSLKGRHPKTNVARTPRGQISRALKNAGGLYHPAATKRAALAAMSRMGDPQWGTVIGRLFLQEKLTPVQYEAGKRWDALVARYHQATGAPQPNAKSASIDFTPRSAEPDPTSDAGLKQIQEHREIIAAFDSAHAELCALGQLTEKAVRDTCEKSMEPVGYDGLLRLRGGLETLGKFWRLAKL